MAEGRHRHPGRNRADVQHRFSERRGCGELLRRGQRRLQQRDQLRYSDREPADDRQRAQRGSGVPGR